MPREESKKMYANKLAALAISSYEEMEFQEVGVGTPGKVVGRTRMATPELPCAFCNASVFLRTMPEHVDVNHKGSVVPLYVSWMVMMADEDYERAHNLVEFGKRKELREEGWDG